MKAFFKKVYKKYIKPELGELVILPEGRFLRLLLLGGFLLGIFLRVAGLAWGLYSGNFAHGSPYHDESHVMGIVFLPDYLQQFYEYEVGRAVYFWRLLAQVIEFFDIIGASYRWIALRMFTAFFGIASIYVVYLIAAKTINKRAAIFAVYLYSLLPGHWFMSQLLKEEAILAFFMPAALYSLSVLWVRKTMFWYVVTGLILGIGMAIKTSFGLILPFAGLIVLAILWQERRKLKKIVKNLAVFAGVAFLSFATFFPYPFCCSERFQYVLKDPQTPYSRFSIDRFGFSPSHFESIWKMYQSTEIPYFTIQFSDLITSLLWVSIGVFALYLIRNWIQRKDFLLSALVLGTFLFYFSLLNQYGDINEDRYIVPLSPFIALFITRLFFFNSGSKIKVFGRTLPAIEIKASLFTLAMLTLIYVGLFTKEYFIPFAFADPRHLAAVWLYDHVDTKREKVFLFSPSRRDKIYVQPEKIVTVEQADVETGKVKPTYIVLQQTPTYRGRWGGDFYLGEIKKKPYGAVLPKIIDKHYHLVQVIGQQPEVFGRKQPETILTPIYEIYQRL